MENLRDKYAQQTVSNGGGFNDIAGSKGNGNSKRADTIKIEKDENIFRVLPPHLKDGAQGRFLGNLNASWLPVMVDVYGDDGKPTGEKKRIQKPIFNSLVHAKGILDFDLVDEYIKFNDKLAERKFGKDTDKYKAWMLPLLGDFNKGVNGIRPKDHPRMYVVTVDRNTNRMNDKIGLLDLKTISVVNQLKFLGNKQNGSQSVSPDIYSNALYGVPFIVDYNPAAQAQDKYKVTLYEPKVRNSLGKQEVVEFPLSDEILEQLESFPSLNDLFGPQVFKANDFKLQMLGLKIFDAENNKIFSTESRWQEMADEFEKKAYAVLGEPVEYKPRSQDSTSSTSNKTASTPPVPTGTTGLPFEEEEDDTKSEPVLAQQPPASVVQSEAPKTRWNRS